MTLTQKERKRERESGSLSVAISPFAEISRAKARAFCRVHRRRRGGQRAYMTAPEPRS